MITYYKRTIKDLTIRKIERFEVGCWINVINPLNEEIDFLCTEFNLDKRNLLSGLDENEIPRFDIVNENIYILTKVINNPFSIKTFLIVIGNEFVLTLVSEEPDFFKLIKNDIEFVTTQKIRALIKLMSYINKNFEREIVSIVKEVRTIGQKKSYISEQQIEILLVKENYLNLLASTYKHQILVYDRILKHIPIFKQDKEIITDLIEEMHQGFDLCSSSLKTIANIRTYYGLLLSV